MSTLAALRALVPFPLPDGLERLYATPPRAYHSLAHVEFVLRLAAPLHAEGHLSREALLALLLHDAIYDVARHDNEAESAKLGAAAAGPLGLEPARVAALIEATAKHGGLAPGDVDEETALLLDCDLAVLGADEATYDAYEAGVRAEYLAVVPAELYEAGRRHFLEGLLARERLFLSAHFHARFDAKARANLRRTLGP